MRALFLLAFQINTLESNEDRAIVADDTEMAHLVDEWEHSMLREGKYTPGQIDSKWSREMVEEFNQWLKQKGSKLRMPLP